MQNVKITYEKMFEKKEKDGEFEIMKLPESKSRRQNQYKKQFL